MTSLNSASLSDKRFPKTWNSSFKYLWSFCVHIRNYLKPTFSSLTSSRSLSKNLNILSVFYRADLSVIVDKIFAISDSKVLVGTGLQISLSIITSSSIPDNSVRLNFDYVISRLAYSAWFDCLSFSKLIILISVGFYSIVLYK